MSCNNVLHCPFTSHTSMCALYKACLCYTKHWCKWVLRDEYVIFLSGCSAENIFDANEYFSAHCDNENYHVLCLNQCLLLKSDRSMEEGLYGKGLYEKKVTVLSRKTAKSLLNLAVMDNIKCRLMVIKKIIFIISTVLSKNIACPNNSP